MSLVADTTHSQPPTVVAADVACQDCSCVGAVPSSCHSPTHSQKLSPKHWDLGPSSLPNEGRSRLRWQTVTVSLCLFTLFVVASSSSSVHWSRIKIGGEDDKFYFKGYKEKDGQERAYEDELEGSETYDRKAGTGHACDRMIDDFRVAGENTTAAYWIVWAAISATAIMFTIYLDQNGEKRVVKLATTVLFFLTSTLWMLPIKAWTVAVPSTSTVSACYCSTGCPIEGTHSTFEPGGISCYIGVAACLIGAIVNHNDKIKATQPHSSVEGDNHV